MTEEEFAESLDRYQESIYFRKINDWQNIEDRYLNIEQLKNDIVEAQKKIKLQQQIIQEMERQVSEMEEDFADEYQT